MSLWKQKDPVMRVNLPTQDLPRQLNMWDGAAIVTGAIIGAGIFRVPGAIANVLPIPSLALLAWLVGGFLSLCGALCYAELASAFPKAGGDYVFLREAYGSAVAFVFGWTKFLVIHTGAMASMAFIFAEYVAYFIPLTLWKTRLVAMAALLLLTFINIWGITWGKKVQNTTTLIKVLALAGILVLGVLVAGGRAANFQALASVPAQPLPLIPAFGMALIFVLWTYGGWSEAAYVAEEIREPGRNVPRAMFVGLGVVTFLYCCVNLVYLFYIPQHVMQTTDVVAAYFMEQIAGTTGGAMVAILVLISTFGALNAYILTGGRISFALARDHAIFKRISAVHPRFQTPAAALLINGAWASVLVASGTFERLIAYTTSVAWFFFALTGVSLFVLRRTRPNTERPYRAWGYPVMPLVFTLTSVWLMMNTVLAAPRESLCGLVIMALGLPVFFLARKVTT